MRKILLTLSFFSALNLFAADVKIEADRTSGCAPLTVNFGSATGTEWSWDFGNGNNSTQKNPTAVFMKEGTYTVNLTAKTSKGKETTSLTITVNASPKADFTIEKTKACENETLHFTNTSVAGAAPIAKYVWGFGDGKTVTQANVEHRYTEAGNYNVTLVVTDANGCTADKTSYSSIVVNPMPVAAFTPSVTSSCAEAQKVSFTNQSKGNKLNYSWNFGDGSASTDEKPTHVFQQGKHNVVLTVKDINGCSAQAEKLVSVTKLKADFEISNETPVTEETVKFFSTSNFKGTSWSWNFGDGTTSNLHAPQKIYSKTGNYTVKFTLTDGNCSAVESKMISVSKGTPVSFTSNITSSCVYPMSVSFKNTTPNTALALWEFGDGTVSTNPNPEKVFTQPGTYKVTLSVTDSSGNTVKKGIDNYIHAAKPMVRFGGDTFGCVGYPVKFFNYTPNALSYVWNFGDGETSTLKNPTHIYKENGFYTVSLTAKNGTGCDSTFTVANFVHIDTLKADFEVIATKSAVPPFLCTFTNTTVPSNVKYVWDFGDGTSENSANPIHLYDTPGNFKVRLVAYNKAGCSAVKVQDVSFQMGTALESPVILSGE